MKDIWDIPAPWYVRHLIWATRKFRRNRRLRRIVANVRDRCVLGVVTKMHLEAIHPIRRFALNRDMLLDSSLTYEALESLANGCRNTMADVLEAFENDLHCTIKLIGDGAQKKKEEWPVFTVARSTPCERPADFGRCNAHYIGKNSGFASITGANDRKNTWIPNVYPCFVCNDLTHHSTYDCSRDNWSSYFRATAVFPLRFRRPDQKEHNILGYLTFDTMEESLFSGLPCIFHTQHDKAEYERQLAFSAAFHVGAILADTLACAFYPLLPKVKEDGRDPQN